MIRVGIIGCGRIADQHAIEIKKIPDCEIVGACDKEELMARQFCERFNIKNYFSDVRTLLDSTNPNVVHICTPPQSHSELGTLCLNSQCNVMFEKPLALNTGELEALIAIANNNHLKITVDHNVQFSHASLQMRELIESGYLGGPPIHLESIWCYGYGDPGYAKALLGEKHHWVRKLPGKMLHNIISHGVSKIAEFLRGDSFKIETYAYTSPFLNEIREKDLLDELRSIISDDSSTTAYFTFSTRINPPLHQFRVYGPKRSLIVDDLQQTLITSTEPRKSYLNYFVPPLDDAKKHFLHSVRNVKRFIKRDLYFEYGRKHLIQRFYRSITSGEPVPIPYDQILRTSRIMDGIFDQLKSYSQ